MRNFFISYNQADRRWAEWLGWQLEEQGYSVFLQHWDFRPGSNFVLDMHKAAQEAQRTIMGLFDRPVEPGVLDCHPLARTSRNPKRAWLVREITNYKSQITKMGCPSDRFKRLRRGVRKFFLSPIGLFVISDIVICNFIFYPAA